MPGHPKREMRTERPTPRRLRGDVGRLRLSNAPRGLVCASRVVLVALVMALMACSGLGDDGDAVLTSFARLLFASPATAFDAGVVDGVVDVQTRRGTLDPRAFYLGEDRDTHGDWPGAYGRGAYILCAMTEYDIAGGPEWPLELRFRTADQSRKVKVYIGKSNSDSTAALRDPYRRTRTIAWRNDHTRRDSFDLAGPDLITDVAIPAGQWLVSFYIVDPDWASTEHPRDLSIVLSELTQATPLAVARATDLAEGVYYRFLVTGPLALSTRICKHRSPDANLSGIFLDRVERLRPVPEALARTSALSATHPIARQYAATSEALLTDRLDWPAYVRALHGLQTGIEQFRLTRSAAWDPAAEWMRWQVATHLGDTAEACDAIACLTASLHVGREPQEEQECLESLLDTRAAGGFGVDGGPLSAAATLQRLAQVATGEARLQALEQLARLRVDLVDDAGAAEAYRQIIETAPAGEYLSRAHFGLGMFLYQQNQGEQALAEFRLAVDAAPASVDGELAKLFVDRLEQAGGDAAHAGGQ